MNCSFDNNNSSLSLSVLKHSPKFTILVNQFNSNTRDDNNKDAENFIHSKYFDINELQKLKILSKENCLSLFHINACSLSRNCDEL